MIHLTVKNDPVLPRGSQALISTGYPAVNQSTTLILDLEKLREAVLLRFLF